MPKAHTENGQLPGKLSHNVQGVTCLVGRAGARRNHNRFRLEIGVFHLVIALYQHLLAELLEIARDVVNKAVIIIDNEDHGANASVMRLILVRVSSYSAAGSERAVTPPPPWKRAVPFENITVRMAMLRSTCPLNPK